MLALIAALIWLLALIWEGSPVNLLLLGLVLFALHFVVPIGVPWRRQP